MTSLPAVNTRSPRAANAPRNTEGMTPEQTRAYRVTQSLQYKQLGIMFKARKAGGNNYCTVLPEVMNHICNEIRNKSKQLDVLIEAGVDNPELVLNQVNDAGYDFTTESGDHLFVNLYENDCKIEGSAHQLGFDVWTSETAIPVATTSSAEARDSVPTSEGELVG